MTGLVEWTGAQQFLCLVQSMLLGAVLGLLFEVFTALTRIAKRRVTVFILDSVFGILSAMITFYTSLVISNGRLHPLLFFGGLAGYMCEHFTVGRYISKGLSWLFQRLFKGLDCGIRFCDSSIHRFCQWSVEGCRRCVAWQNLRQTKPKTCHFFSKKP